MAIREKQGIRGEVLIRLKEISSGKIVQERRVKNAIMNEGSRLLALLFCGESGECVKTVGVGTDNTNSGIKTLTDLVAPVLGSDAVTPVRAAVQPADGAASCVTVTEAGDAVARMAATFDAGEANGALVEAGLFNTTIGGTLYNRVVFPVINKADTHELTLIWEVTFSA